MKRNPILVALALLLPFPAIAQVTAPAIDPFGHPWAMRRATTERTGQSTYPGAAYGMLDWRFPIAGRVNQFAVGQDGSIYLGAVFNEESWSNEVYSYALTSTGDLKYRVKVKPYPWGSSQNVFGSPAIDSTGNVILPSTLTQLIKFTPDGDPLWTYQGQSNYISDGSPAVLPDDSIRHLIYTDGIVALTRDGFRLFSTSVWSQMFVAVAPNGDMAAEGLRTIEPHGSVDIYYFNADGTLRWRLDSSNGEAGIPIFGPDGTVYYNFRAFQPNGTQKWRSDAVAAAFGANGVLYAVGNGVVALNPATGARIWTVPIPYGAFQEIAIDSGGKIFATSPNGFLYSISPLGTVNWGLKVCDCFYGGPAIGANENVLAFGSVGFQYFVFSIK